MIYQIKQKIFSFGDKFSIKDEMGQDVFYVRGKVFSLGNKLSIEDLDGNEVVYIEQKLFKFLPEYSIYLYGSYAAKVKKELSFFKSSFVIDSSFGNYKVEGDFFSLNFTILKNGITVAKVDKEFFSFSDTYGADINDNEDQAFMLALVIVIDQVLHDNNHNNN